jgi:hypothetical protein
VHRYALHTFNTLIAALLAGHDVEHSDAFLSVLISCDSLSDPRTAAA